MSLTQTAHFLKGSAFLPISWALLLILASANLHAQTPCEQLSGLHLKDARILSAKLVPPGEVSPRPNSNAFADNHVAEHCEVKGVATPTSDSEIQFELWLPLAPHWNGKYIQEGNGGWAGHINPLALVTPLNRGYAAAATDDGHKGDGTASFAVGHPEKLIDFGYRAIHQTSVQSRAIMQAFYGKPLEHAYFVGCSDGGREALMQAERFPEDFNGIVAGAPANHWSHQLTSYIWGERALFENGASVLPASKLGLLESEALRECDSLDGLRDDILEDPSRCHFDPDVLLCKAGDQDNCLTAAQLAAVKKIYSGPKDPVTGKQIYPGFEPGMEASSWETTILNGGEAKLGNSNFADAVYEHRGWDWRTSDLHQDLQLADQKEAPSLDAYNPDLRSFRDHGGKLIEYQGWEDPIIAPQDTIDFYNMVRQFMAQYPDPRLHGPNPPIQSFYRLFMVPGMSHCGGGIGPNIFTGAPIAGLPEDADHDIVLALDRWVVDGVPPERIVATKILNPHRARTDEVKVMTRPLCVYPKVARYKGAGSTDDANNFDCAPEPPASQTP